MKISSQPASLPIQNAFSIVENAFFKNGDALVDNDKMLVLDVVTELSSRYLQNDV